MSLFTIFTGSHFATTYSMQFSAYLEGVMTYLRDQSSDNREAVVQLVHRGVLAIYRPNRPPEWADYSRCESFADDLLTNLVADDAAFWIKLSVAALACDYNLASRWLDALRGLRPPSAVPLRPTG